MDNDLARRAEAYLSRVLKLKDFQVISADPISGAGLSRQVVRLVTRSAEQGGEVGYILLLQQSTSPVEPNSEAEFAVLRALAYAPEVKVAPAVWREADPQFLGAPFLLTGLLPGIAKPQSLLEPEYLPFARPIVEESFRTLGRLAAQDIRSLDLSPLAAAPSREDVWTVELARWEKVLRESGCNSLVVTNAALRRLRNAPPPPPDKLSIVHGDYRVGNYMYDGAGITGIIDWEMVHLGDAIEDLAWSLMPNWQFSALPGRVGGLLTPQEAQAAWESTSGRVVDAAALAWWTLFCHVKAVAIWATARHLVASGRGTNMVMALVGYGLVEKEESYLVDLLREAGP